MLTFPCFRLNSKSKEIKMNSIAEFEGRDPFTPARLEHLADLWEAVSKVKAPLPEGADLEFARQRAVTARGVAKHMSMLGIVERRNIGPFQLDSVEPGNHAVLKAGKPFGTTAKRKSPSSKDMPLIVRRVEEGWTVNVDDDLRRQVVDPSVKWSEKGYHFWAAIEDLEFTRG
jgi:hypothetical protein